MEAGIAGFRAIRVNRMNDRFIKGIDISSYPEMLDMGYRYYDENGHETDLLDYAVRKGVNYGRLRIWNHPENIPEAGHYCDLQQTISMAGKIKAHGMKLLLDFHYSDWWADPGHQAKPKAWEALHGGALEKAVYDYTYEVISQLIRVNACPDMVQIGNEIRCGMLWPDGRADNREELAALINAGIRAVRDVQKEQKIEIVLHLDQGGRYYYYEEWFDHVIAEGVTDFDIIGLSYYPFWHGSVYDLKETMEKLSVRYHRDLILAETAYAYRYGSPELMGEQQEKLSGFPATPEGQRQVLELLMNITAHVSNQRGRGIFYWEPFLREKEGTEGWGSCMGLMDRQGHPLEAMNAFQTDPYEIPPVKLEEICPDAVHTTYSAREIQGDGQELSLQAYDRLLSDEAENLLSGQNSAGRVKPWMVEQTGTVRTELRQEIQENPPFKATDYLYVQSSGNFVFRLTRKILIEEAGRYQMKLSYRGDNTTGVKVELLCAGKNEITGRRIYPGDTCWTEYESEIRAEEQEELEVGILIDAPAVYGMIKNIILLKI